VSGIESGIERGIERGIAREIAREIRTAAEIETGTETGMIDTDDTTILPAGGIQCETLKIMIQPPSLSYPTMKSRGLSRKLWTIFSRKENGFLHNGRDINWSSISTRL